MTEATRRILISAHLCTPGDGSEAGAGWAIVEAATVHHEVWVITQPQEVTKLRRRLAKVPGLANRIYPVCVGTAKSLDHLRKRNRDFYWHYPLWQQFAGGTARRLHREEHFDVMHHVVFATDWQPVGLLRLPDVPLVLGPVGGATYPPTSLVAGYGQKAFTRYERTRQVVTTMGRQLFGRRIVERAAVRVALNQDTARTFGTTDHVYIEANACVDLAEAEIDIDWFPPGSPGRRALFVGQLIAWKRCWLAADALSRPQAQDWTLTVVGDGPDRENLEARARALGVAGRVRFLGRRARPEVLAAHCQADALIFPSLHDSSPWAVAEAHDAGSPVICLDLGGPPALRRGHDIAVSPHGDIPDALASALRDAPDRRPPGRTYAPDRVPGLLAQWYDEATTAKP